MSLNLNAVPQVERDKPEIQKVLEELSSTISRLEVLFERTDERMASVMAAQEDKPVRSPESSYGTLLGRELGCCVERLKTLEANISDLLGRIQL